LPEADMIFNIVFFIVLTSILLQGTSLPLVARWLRLDEPVPAASHYPLELVPTGNLRAELVEVSVPENAAVAGKQIVEAGLPRGALITLVRRNQEFLVPNGDTVLRVGDKLLVLASEEGLASLRSVIEQLAPVE
jgi:cell volume regulation protein A